MRLSGVLVSLLAVESCKGLVKRDYDTYDYYAVHIRPEAQPESLADHLGVEYGGPLGELRNHHIFRASIGHQDYDHIKAAISDLKRRRRKREAGAESPHLLDHILLSQKQDLRKRFPLVKRDDNVAKQTNDALASDLELLKGLDIKDPIFQDQWHLFNPIQVGHDLNVSGVWAQNITGKGSTVCIVDDGLDMNSDDLRDNYFAAGSYDFNDQTADPLPRLFDDRHGTRCAGEVAAVRNDVCGVGVAYDGKVSGVRILSKVISNADEATAMNYAFQENDIYSCSWGPPDDGQSMEAPDIIIERAMVTGVQEGRRGLGSIYVFAIGNGASRDDNCNFDGYTNSIYSVSVGGIDRKGLHPYYSEKCSAQLVVTYSSGSNDAIHTTDVGKNECYTNHGGTSAAGPLVAGIYALALEANRNLTWRDIQYLTVLTAVKVDQPSDWAMNKALGKEFSHQFGYGKADAGALVEMAKTWTTVKPQAWYFSPWLHVNHPIPQADKGLASSFNVTQELLTTANLERIEHVTVTMNIKHTRRGDLSVELLSPAGMVSHIATHRRDDEARAGYIDWTFMSVAHWGETGVGTWTVIVKDTNINAHNGTFTDWRLKLYGESIDADKQELLPLPNLHDDDNHLTDDKGLVTTQTVSVATTTVAVPTDTGKPPGNPDDHQHRPVNSKITTTTTTTSSPTTTALPDSTAATTANPNFLPRPFPTFGVSPRTQIWIYGSLALILLFLSCLGGWWLYMRRRAARRSRDEYSFEMVAGDDEDEGGFGGPGGRRKRRAGELYDAFAEGEDDDEGSGVGEEVFGVGSDDDHDDEGEQEVEGERGEKRYREREARF